MDRRYNKAEEHAYFQASRFLKELPSERIQMYQDDLEELFGDLQLDGASLLGNHTDVLRGLRRAMLEFDPKIPRDL